MNLNDGFALRNGVENLGDTVRDVVLDNVFDKEPCEGDTNHRGDEIPPVVLGDELVFHEMLDSVNHELEQLCCARRQRSHKETQNEDEVLLWDMLLTPTKFVPHEWFGELKGKKVLGLASGGGQQMPIFAALGAACTVLDYSEKQLESERMVARREGYQIEIIRADMTKPLPFADETFDTNEDLILFDPIDKTACAPLHRSALA